MNIHVNPADAKKRDARVGLAIADGDIHPGLKTPRRCTPISPSAGRITSTPTA